MVKQTSYAKVLTIFSLIALLLISSNPVMANAEKAKEETAYHYGVSAYIWGYPLVRTERVQRDRVHTSASGVPQTALNQFSHIRELRDADYKAIATPNNDTLYSQAYLDLRKEPIVIQVPAIEDRYYVLPMLSAYQDVFTSIGTRETGTKAGNYAIVGPNWQGKLPKGIKRIDAPTDTVMVWGRVGVNGKQDLAAAQAVQDSLVMVPLSQYGKKKVAADWQTSRERVALTAWDEITGVPESLSFFYELGEALKLTELRPEDAATIEQFSHIGLSPEKGFDLLSLDPASIAGLARGIQTAEQIIDNAASENGTFLNGWVFSTETGIFGNDYLLRAAIAKWYMAANIPAEAMYYVGKTTADGKPFNGNNHYQIHFPAKPPANAFWSLSIYNSSDGSFVANELDRYSIGDRTAGIKTDADGSLDIYIQAEKPEAKYQANWLPAPDAPFYLLLRLYIPEDEVVSGDWQPPEVELITK